MSKLVYCAIEPCFRKIICDNSDDVMKLGWAKLEDGYSCENHTWESNDG